MFGGKYDKEESRWRSWEARDEYRIGLWKVIKKNWDLFNSKVLFSIDNERRVKFWKDKWYENIGDKFMGPIKWAGLLESMFSLAFEWLGARHCQTLLL